MNWNGFNWITSERYEILIGVEIHLNINATFSVGERSRLIDATIVFELLITRDFWCSLVGRPRHELPATGIIFLRIN